MNRIIELNQNEISSVGGGFDASNIGGTLGALAGIPLSRYLISVAAELLKKQSILQIQLPWAAKATIVVTSVIVSNWVGHAVFGTIVGGLYNVYRDFKETIMAIFGKT